MELEKLVVELDPFVPLEGAEAHRDVVFWTIAKGAVGKWLRGFDGPVWVRWWIGSLEGERFPFCLNESASMPFFFFDRLKRTK